MTDFDYDVMQKKRLARNQFHNAKYKHGGCHLPHEDLTPAQMKRRNGPMMTYSMNQPMSWNAFKCMPHDLQQQYLDGLHACFGVGPSDIAKYLFLCTPNNLHQSTVAMGLTAAKRDKNCDLDGFLAWLRKADEDTRAAETEKKPEVNTEGIHAAHPALDRLTIELTGDDLPNLFNGLSAHITPYCCGRRARVQVTVTFETP